MGGIRTPFMKIAHLKSWRMIIPISFIPMNPYHSFFRLTLSGHSCNGKFVALENSEEGSGNWPVTMNFCLRPKAILRQHLLFCFSTQEDFITLAADWGRV